MYKLVKWAYDMGARQENQRIRIAIAKCQQELADQYTQNDFLLRDNSMAEKVRAKIDKELIVNRRVNNILNNLLFSRTEIVEIGNAPIDRKK